jgi:heat shock protein HslJ
MSKKIIILVFVLALVWITSACGPREDQSGSIQDINWQWESVKVQSTGETTTVPNPENYTLIFREDGTFEGQADCNQISGSYSQEGGFTITVGPSTMAFCGEDSLDQQYLTLLSSVAAGGPDGSSGLALETAGGAERMLFVDNGAAPLTHGQAARRQAAHQLLGGLGAAAPGGFVDHAPHDPHLAPDYGTFRRALGGYHSRRQRARSR